MKELVNSLEKRQLTCTELVQKCLARIAESDPELNAFVTVDAPGALAQAQAADQRRAQGACLSIWDGIPIAIKDSISTRGLKTTCASRFLADYCPVFDATVVQRLREQGLVILGKTNLDEFAMGSSTEYSARGVTHNPHDLKRVAGGSSGGSAAAVAADQVPWALGSDTGGSIRQPASFCGVVGLRPTYGRVSRYGVVALAPSLDQAGPLAKTVEDAANLFALMAGVDPLDPTSARAGDFSPPTWQPQLIRGLKIGVPDEFFGSGLDPEVEGAVQKCLDMLQEDGAILVPLSLASNRFALDTYLTIVTAEASSSLARYDGVRYGARVAAGDSNTMFARSRSALFGAEVKRRIMLGTYILSASNYEAYYQQALKVRAWITQDVVAALESVDVIITPTTPTTAFAIGEKRDPLHMYLSDLYTTMASLSGLPALSLPCGYDSANLPIGLQIMGGYFQEELILQVAYAIEQSRERGANNAAL